MALSSQAKHLELGSFLSEDPVSDKVQLKSLATNKGRIFLADVDLEVSIPCLVIEVLSSVIISFDH